MKKFHIEKLKDISSKEKMEKKQLFFLHENSSNSIVSKSISLDSFEANNNSKYSSNNPSTQSEINSDNYADNKLIFDNKDTNEGNNKFNLLRKKTKITFNITKRTKKKQNFLLLLNISKILIIYSLEKIIIRIYKRFAEKRNYFRHINVFIGMIQSKILMEEDGHMKSILNLLNHLLIMEKIGKLFRNMLVLEVINK